MLAIEHYLDNTYFALYWIPLASVKSLVDESI